MQEAFDGPSGQSHGRVPEASRACELCFPKENACMFERPDLRGEEHESRLVAPRHMDGEESRNQPST